jgi:ankyrin repeat protein
MKKNNPTAIATISTPSFEDFKKPISERNLDAIKILIDNNHKFPMPFNDYLKALNYSVELGHIEVVDLLIKNMSPDSINQLITAGIFHLAAKSGSIDLVEFLTDKGIDVNQADEIGKTALHFAAENGHTGLVQFLVNTKGVSINQADYYRETALLFAAKSGNIDLVEFLIYKGIDVNQACENGRTALHYAAANGHTGLVQWMIEKGANVNQADEFGYTALHKAAEKGHIDIVESLTLKMTPDAINKANTTGYTALHKAAKKGHIDIVELLVKTKGVNINQADKYSRNPLHFAAANGHIDLVQWIIEENEVNINQADGYGKTALHGAAENGHIEIVKLLVNTKGVNINQVSGVRKTVLHYAASQLSIYSIKVVELLLQKMTAEAINQANYDGDTALHEAASQHSINSIKVVELLLQKMTPEAINQADELGRTALHRAASQRSINSIKVVELLLQKMTPEAINKATTNGWTALHWAAYQGNIEVVELLLQKMTPEAINQPNQYGQRALNYAADEGNIQVVELLLQQMTPEAINQANYDSDTALDMPAAHTHKDVVNLITYYLKIHNLTAIDPSIDKHIEDSFEFNSGGGETKRLITSDVFKKLLLQKYPESSLFHEYCTNLQILKISTNESSSVEVKESVEKFYEIACKFKEESTNKMDDIGLMFIEQGSFEGVKMTFLQIKSEYASLFDIVEILEKFQKGEPLQSEQSILLKAFKKSLKIENDSELFDEKGGINSKLIIEDYIEGKAVQDKGKEAIEFFIHNPEYRVAGSFFKMIIEKHKDGLVDRINSDKDFKDAILELKNYILPLEIKKFIEELERQDSTDETESSKGFEVEPANGDYEDFNEVERKHDEEDLESTSVTASSDRLTDYHNEARIEYTGEGCLQSIGEEIVESNNLFSNPRDVFERHGIELNVVLTGDIENSGTEGSL